jgi:hypothetical protein
MQMTFGIFVALYLKYLIFLVAGIMLLLLWLITKDEKFLDLLIQLFAVLPWWVWVILVLLIAGWYLSQDIAGEEAKTPAASERGSPVDITSPPPTSRGTSTTYCLNVISLAKARHGSRWIEDIPQDQARQCEWVILQQAAKDLIP